MTRADRTDDRSDDGNDDRSDDRSRSCGRARSATWAATRGATWGATRGATRGGTWGALLLGAGLASSCAAPPVGLTLAPPARVVRALSLVEDLGATVTLEKGGEVVATVPLASEDGARFSGFVEADPGRYTLAVTFTGVVAGDAASGRRFLGRLVSDELLVVQGDAARPTFSRGLDTIGGPDDRGDDDADGLGLLDELLVGADPAAADSDADGVDDGDDCDPTSAAGAFVIVDGGSLDDCDGDGFVRVDPVFADAGDDCGDTDPAVHPGAADDCGTVRDEDCTPATCPVDDADGPIIALVSPAAGATVGCGAVVDVDIADPSGVESATLTFVDDDIAGSPRVLLLRDDDDDGRWTSAPLLSLAGTGYRPGAHAVDVRATDGVGNTAHATGSFAIDVASPTVQRAGPAAVADAPATVTFRATSPSPIVRVVVFQAPPSASFPSLFDLTRAALVAELPAGGGEVTLEPSTFTARSVVWAEVEDAIGRVAAPIRSGNVSVNADGTLSQATCDGTFTATMPAVVVTPPADAADARTMRDLVDDAVARARALDAAARLTAAFGLGAGADGRIDLGDVASFSKRWEFQFLTASGDSIKVRYLTPAFGAGFPETPQIEQSSGPPNNEEPLTGDLANILDSPAVAALYGDSPGCGALTGNDNDMLILQHVNGQDRWLAQANGGGSLAVDAATLAVIFACN